MQFTPEQVKGKIKNIAKENKEDARILMRIHMMERFLERVRFLYKGIIINHNKNRASLH